MLLRELVGLQKTDMMVMIDTIQSSLDRLVNKESLISYNRFIRHFQKYTNFQVKAKLNREHFYETLLNITSK